MIALKYLDRIERLHLLIKRKATGPPKELAYRLQVSEASVYEYIKTLKELGGPVTYDLFRKSYVYDRPCSLNLRYDVRPLKDDEITYAQAGYRSAKLFLYDIPHYATLTLVA